MIRRYFYGADIGSFLAADNSYILGHLAHVQAQALANLASTQTGAWEDEIAIMKKVLTDFSGRGFVFFEFSIPRMGRRADVIAVIEGLVFVIEFKVGATEYLQNDINQVWDYALDLKNFHESSHNKTIVPVLIATDAPSVPIKLAIGNAKDHVYEPVKCNEETLKFVIEKAIATIEHTPEIGDIDWAMGRYAPTPTIIEAAAALYNHHDVKEISRSDAQNLEQTCDFIQRVIEYSKLNSQKAICFVTGVPGAGKTLVGLNIATQKDSAGEHPSMENLAVYLSGNFPLVQVLTEALARDQHHRLKQSGKNSKIGEARSQVKTFIQMIHHYRDTCMQGTKIADGQIVKDESYFSSPQNADKSFVPIDHVAIFDEAQRAWTKDALANFMKRKKGVDNFPMSEPAFLISCLDRHRDWAVIVCLVGGGQEINTGEAGIKEWVEALNKIYPNWHVYISDKLKDAEYDAGQVLEHLSAHNNLHTDTSLHLATSLRSFRAENLSQFVGLLLDKDAEGASQILAKLQNYPLVMTRNLEKAKRWLKSKARGNERYGMIVSSRAQRLKPLAIDVRLKPDVVHWFLDDNTDVRSSFYLEDVATEFDVQGLELDWACVVWDGDFRYENDEWRNYNFVGDKWQKIHNENSKAFQKNAYRVLMTRARQGMILVVPEGSHEDKTRKPEFYDSTYNYFKKIGIPEI